MSAVLGVSCDYHDAAAAVCVDGRVVAAAEEERFSRVKHDAALPVAAMASCLAIAGVAPDELDQVVFYEKPLEVLARFVQARRRQGPRSLGPFVRDLPTLVTRNLMVGDRLDRALRDLGATRRPRLAYAEHHVSHAAAAFYPSPFETAAVVTVDGVGESATASIGRGAGRHLDLIEEVRFPSSIGLLYSLVTAWCGFAPNDGEYKVMGLAPYGTPRFEPALRGVIDLRPGGGFAVDGRRVGWWTTPPERMRSLARILDGGPRHPSDPLTEREADLAASIQVVVEETVLGLVRRARELTGERTLCLAGGVALNCVANGKVADAGIFDDLWVQPAAGDAGSAVGAALWWWHETHGADRPAGGHDAMGGAALGPRFGADEVSAWLGDRGVPHRRVTAPADLADEVAGRLAAGALVGWFEGRMEFGPRALGHRSILADPRSATVQADLNGRVKGREGFRPFAPAVPWEDAPDWFDIDRPSPYMLRTVGVRADRLEPVDVEPATIAERAVVRRSAIPACTHIDGSARVQTVEARDHPRFHELLVAFGRVTGCPVLLNTSFNVAGEPIVGTPEEALATARRAGLDVLVVEDSVVELAAIG